MQSEQIAALSFDGRRTLGLADKSRQLLAGEENRSPVRCSYNSDEKWIFAANPDIPAVVPTQKKFGSGLLLLKCDAP